MGKFRTEENFASEIFLRPEFPLQCARTSDLGTAVVVCGFMTQRSENMVIADTRAGIAAA
jgi:hypothetical protein